mgnify:CR=1 FL=1
MKRHFIGSLSDLQKELDRKLEKWFIVVNVNFICCLWLNDIEEIDLFLITYENRWNE